MLGPLDAVEIAEQPLGVVGDTQEPLFELPYLHERPAAIAVPVHDLLIGEDSLVVRAPLHSGLFAVGQPGLEQL